MRLMKHVELLRAACCVAGADGQTVPSEREILTRIAADADLRNELLEYFIGRSETDRTFSDVQFRRGVSDSVATLEFLFAVAKADNRLTVGELNVLFRIAERLRLSEDQFARLRAAALLEVRKAA